MAALGVRSAAVFHRRSCPRVAFFGERIGEVDPALVEGSVVAGSEIVLGAGSVDGFCEQIGLGRCARR